jgi:uncharacterized protein (TIGR02996 family)
VNATESLYQLADYRAFYAACCADPQDSTGWGALRDWLREHGAGEHTVAEVEPFRRLSQWDIDRFLGRGSGRGIGRGSGRGRGSGSGSGRGSGRGSGSGSGRGSGSGSGSGSGRGSGSGSGSGSEPIEVKQMEIGECYLVHCGDWHTFVGRVVRQVGPQMYQMESVSKILETNNGDCWEELAAGNEDLRKAASYKHYTTSAVVPLSIIAFVWTGVLPQEAAQPARKKAVPA